MPRIESRHALLNALSEAAEVEHALLCQYLFAAYSIRRSPGGGLSPLRLKSLQDWAGTLLVVAREEMDHLGTVCNLLAAIGGAPVFRRPNFPQPARYFGEAPAFSLTRFSLPTVRRFIEFEKPEYLHLREAIARATGRQDGHVREDLASILGTIGTDGLWAYGEAWVREGPVLRLAATWAERPGADALTALRARAIERSREGSVGCPEDAAAPGAGRLIDHAWTSARWRTATIDAYTLPGRGDGPRQAGLDTAAAIPLLADGRPRGVLVFAYRTYRTSSEDDAFAQIAHDALNGAENGAAPTPRASHRLGQLLRQSASDAPGLQGASPPAEAAGPQHPERDFSTIGGFYRNIRKGFLALGSAPSSTLFIGPEKAQVGYERIGLPAPGWHNVDPARVTDLHSAVEAIDAIIEEGEGASFHTETSHYARFRLIADELRHALDEDPSFDPARPVASNPVARLSGDARPGVLLFTAPAAAAEQLDRGALPAEIAQGFEGQGRRLPVPEARVEVEVPGVRWAIADRAGGHTFRCHRAAGGVAVLETVTVLEPPATIATAELFDDLYETMLLMLFRLYAHTDDTDDDLKRLAGVAVLPLMTQVLRPLAEVLMEMPAVEGDGRQAGPSFTIDHDLQLLPHRGSAWVVFGERLRSAAAACGRLARRPEIPERLGRLQQNLAHLARQLEADAPSTARA